MRSGWFEEGEEGKRGFFAFGIVSTLALAACWASGCGSATLVRGFDGGTDAPATGGHGNSGAGAGGHTETGGGGAPGGSGGASGGAAGGGSGGVAGASGGASGGNGSGGSGGGIAAGGTGGGGTGGAAAGGTTGAGGGTGGASTGGQSGATGGQSGGGAGSSGCSGQCCADSDCSACQRCTAAHTCSALSSQDDPSGHCAGTCDASGVCKSKKGQHCTATSGGCIAGSTCAPDGYCCNQSCGTDATCAGTCAGQADGGCNYPSGSCGAASCTGNMSKGTGTCATGTCVSPAATTCPGGLICGPSTCKTSCGVDTDCVSTGNYCGVGGTCLAKQGNGLVCAVNSQCTSNICGGRCCPGPAFCSCTQPSSANLVPNAGFDNGLSPWTVPSSSETVSWVSDDAEGCPYSGSASIRAGAIYADETNELLSPCVPLSASTSYNFGMKINGYGSCVLNLYQNANCTGATAGSPNVGAGVDNTAWSSNLNAAFGSGNAQSGRISCTVGSGTMHLDMVYVTPVPGSY